MKVGRLFMLVLIVALQANAANVEKQYKKLVEKYDVDRLAKTSNPDQPSEFWTLALNGNHQLEKFKWDILNNKGMEKEAIQKYNALPHFYPEIDESIVTEMQGFCDSILNVMGITPLDMNCALYVVNSDDVRAFTAPTDNGFAMCLTTGLLSRKGVNSDVVKGYVAHEFARGALQQELQKLYSDIRQQRKDKILTGILAGAVIAGNVALDATTDTDTYDYNFWDNVYSERINKNVEEIIKKMPKEKTEQYAFNYSKDQDAEADLLAYRFMQNIGLAEDYITGLKVLGAAYQQMQNEVNYDPEVSERIQFLNYVSSHPELDRKKK